MSAHTLPPELAQYTVQEIQLEIIRRSHGIQYRTPDLAVFLTEHSDLWTAVVMDRLSLMPHRVTPLMQLPFLPQLRDIPLNVWNALTLYVLTPDKASAHTLIAKAETANIWDIEQERFYEDIEIQYMLQDLMMTMPDCGLFSVWWD